MTIIARMWVCLYSFELELLSFPGSIIYKEFTSKYRFVERNQYLKRYNLFLILVVV